MHAGVESYPQHRRIDARALVRLLEDLAERALTTRCVVYTGFGLLRISLKMESAAESDENASAGPVSRPEPTGWRSWLRRFGVLGFLFFFIKGLLWLTVPLVLVLWRWLEAG